MCSDLCLPSRTGWKFRYFQDWRSFITKQCSKKFNCCKGHLEYSTGVLFLIIFITTSFITVKLAVFEVDDPSFFTKSIMVDERNLPCGNVFRCFRRRGIT